MAEILKIDKVKNNVSNIPTVSTGTSCSLRDAVASNKSKNVENPSIHAFLQDDLILELGCSENPVLENSEKITSEMSTDLSSFSNLHTHMDNLHLGSHSDDVQAPTISFGSYRPFASKPSITDPKKAPSSGSASSIGHFVTRDSEDFGHNHLESISNRSLVSRTAGNGAVEHSSSVYSQPDAARHRYTSFCPDSTLESGRVPDTALAYSQQSVNPGVFSTSELNQQPNLSSGNFADAVGSFYSYGMNAYIPSASQQSVNPGVFSTSELNQKPNLSSGNFADAVGSFYSHGMNAYIPSASQQRAVMNNYIYQSPTATGDTGRMHTRPQLRNSLSTGYGGFESTADISELLKLNRNVMPTRTAFEDFYRFKDNNKGSVVVPVSQVINILTIYS
ncbi:hypothetical protein FRX31_006162 [Thalictrum thalictroides]|uniref:Uncharacterized protein n=1 Tax=Thalictrum thalictroides TaxID=46969 RepID=A0A7J6X5Z1_THATH|nr:hypothetical protein FRX31_006162 [Thalictrum thalictroides]